ncbi:LysR family transcriptional regulator [Velocimicrobium porci]|uniref:LysR family transcriptional regulator n=1 Tax=Velocimicrobium porci TaxID=2606634 RepID=A0A6L5Y156_9FIRM|nr:LysR family transcriptional regulator [Velocimicrobium porci]MSS64138.1 LysR family transcriptional regulator [Velocimicrobium porci]
MTIRHLKIFIEVADSGKMSLAAAKFYISQPTVSQAIRELEEHYGVLLFERLSKRLYITPEGKKLLSYARQAVKQFDELEEAMQITNQTRQIRIGSTITVGVCLLPTIINDLKKQYPDSETYSFVSNTRTIEQKLLQSELDVGLVEGTIKHRDLVSIPMIDDFLVLACSPSHPFATKKTLHLNELADQAFVMREQGSGTRELFEQYLNKFHIPIKIAEEANCPGAIKYAILLNQYLSAISIRLLKDEINENKIHVIKNHENEWNRHFYLVYHKDKVFSDMLYCFTDIVKEYKSPEFLDGLQMGELTRF